MNGEVDGELGEGQRGRLRTDAARAVERLGARAREDVVAWAARLAADLAGFGD